MSTLSLTACRFFAKKFKVIRSIDSVDLKGNVLDKDTVKNLQLEDEGLNPIDIPLNSTSLTHLASRRMFVSEFPCSFNYCPDLSLRSNSNSIECFQMRTISGRFHLIWFLESISRHFYCFLFLTRYHILW